MTKLHMSQEREAEQEPTPARRSTRPVVQTRLRVGSADDPLEREAEEVTRLVMSSITEGESGPAAAIAAGPSTRIRRATASTDAGSPIGRAGGGLDAESESMLSSRIGRGRSLDEPVRRALEPHFGHDFSAVRIHADGPAQELNARMSAEAFTVGNDIFLSRAAPSPTTTAGQGLLAHELTHVVQQGAAPQRRVQRRRPLQGDDLKRMTPEGGNPKGDPPTRKPQPPLEFEEEDEEGSDLVAERAMAATSAAAHAIRRARIAHDRTHAKQKSRVAKHRRQLPKLKGALAIAASNVAKGTERVANEAKHGVLNAGRSIGRVPGMDVKPNTSIRKATGANTRATAAGAYGAVDTEFIEPTFTVKLVGTTWHPVLTNLKGTYGKVTAPLPAGLSEVNGPHATKSATQIADLLRLDGQEFYMVSAVDAHESIHEDHLHDALNNVGGDIAQLFATLTVDQSVAPKAKDAITAIKALPGYNAIANLANPNQSQIRGVWDAEYVNLIDRDHYGPTQNAEGDVVEPMIDRINSWRKKKKLARVKKRWTSTDGSNARLAPAGRKGA